MIKVKDILGSDDQGHPYVIQHKNELYHQTGKTGKDFKTGAHSAEYESYVNGQKSGRRIWHDVNGIIED